MRWLMGCVDWFEAKPSLLIRFESRIRKKLILFLVSISHTDFYCFVTSQTTDFINY